MFDLANFSLRDMTACGVLLRKYASDAGDLSDAAGRMTRFLFENLRDRRTGEPACALVRFFKTCPFSQLSPQLAAFAQRLLGAEVADPEYRCLTLLATAGIRPEWNDCTQSAAHQAIPLPSEQLAPRLPMIAQLLQQLGVEVENLLHPDPRLLVDLEQRTYNVFHVPEVLESPFVPAQEEFVKRYAIRSALGFGGMLPLGDLFTVILFSRVPVRREVAELFRPLALSTKLALLSFVGSPTLSEVESVPASRMETP